MPAQHFYQIHERYTGINNGMIGLGCRELAEALNCISRPSVEGSA